MQVYPLHPAQRDLYFDQLIHPDSPHYNTGGYLRLCGPLDKEQFTAAVNSLPAVFDALKMRLDTTGQEPQLWFDEHSMTEVPEVIDCSDQPAAVTEQWIKDRMNVPFALNKDPLLFEYSLLSINENEHWWYFKFHHIITDGMGFSAIFQYLARKYNALVTGEQALFNYPSYKEETIRASAYCQSDDYAKEGAYWKNRIGEKPGSILKRRQQQEAAKKQGGTYLLDISIADKAWIDELQTTSQVGLQQLTIAALMIYFAKTTQQTSFVFGTPLHKRRTKQLRTIPGMFTGVVPFKGVYQPGTVLLDLLKQITAAQREDYRYQHYMISDLKRALQINAIDEHVVEVVVNHALLDLELPFEGGLQATTINLSNADLAFPLEIMWKDYGKQQPLALRMDYQQPFFSAAEMPLLAERILFILKQFKDRLHEGIEQVEILPEQERALLSTFNDTFTTYPADKTLIDLFTEQVLRNPGATAVVFEETALTYQQLEERANQLAHYLQSMGVKSATLVPICITRSLEMIVGILGILKAGGAYVPIDPDYPAERIRYMLADTGADIILSTHAAAASLPAGKAVRIITLDDEGSNIHTYPKNAPSTTLTSNCLAYVIYTSGSTGKPKGVMVEHRSVVNLVHWHLQTYEVSTASKATSVAGVGFDAFGWEVWPYLSAGASIYVINDQHRLLIPALVQYYIQQGITHSFLPTGLVHEFIHGSGDQPLSLQYLLTGGDRLPATDIKGLTYKVINNYGPTENSVVTTYYELSAKDKDASPLIGRPVSNTTLYITDKNGQLCPVGVPGEICIAGIGIARGYLHQPELTAEKFVQHPFSKDPEARLYRTGDLGRWLADGNMEYLGRMDEQVKVRGYRIEPGEIENVLQECEGVSQAVVIAREDATGNKQLLGYVVPEGAFNREAILAYLGSKLPEYMVPSFLVELESLPFTTNGKVNKNALPAPDAGALSQQTYLAPRNHTEQTLAAIWQELLGVQQVGLYDNFFALGGHSLLAIAATTKINRSLNTQLSPMVLLKHPVLITLAALLQEMRLKEHYLTDHHFALLNGEKDQNMLLFPPAMGQGLVYSALSEQITSHACYSFNYIDDERKFDCYITQIEKIQPEGPYILFGWSAGALLAFEVAKALVKKGHRVSDIIMLDGGRKTDLLDKEKIDKNKIRSDIEATIFEQYKLFKVDEEMLEKLAQDSYGYQRYLAGLINEGSVSANIHLITNEDARKALWVYDWAASTTGDYKIYTGKGKHMDMLILPEDLGANATLINKILDSIHSTRPVYPLHPAQRDLYFDQLIYPDSPHYNTGGYLKLCGSLDKEKFTTAVHSLPAVFDALTMRLDTTGQEPQLYFEDHLMVEALSVIDCNDQPVAATEQWIKDRMNIPFSFNSDPLLFEYSLLSINENEHWWYFKFHHIITDGMGFSAIFQYLVKKYNALVTGEQALFNYPSYKEDAIRAYAYSQSDDYAKEGAYWKNRIGEKPGSILKRRQQPAIAQKQGGTYLLDISAADKAWLDELQTTSQVGLQQLTIAALMIYFAKTTSQTSFVFGTPLHKRRTKQLRTIPGMFTGVVPFKGVYQPGTVLLDLLKQITAAQREDYRYQHYMISDLKRALQINAIDEYVVEVVVNHALLDLELAFEGDIQATTINLSNADLAFPLEIMWKDYGKQQPLALRMDYQSPFFSADEMPLLAQRILFILKQFKDRLHEDIEQVKILPEQEQALLSTFNNTLTIDPAGKTLIDLFTEQVLRTPDATAVVFEETTLTYQQLEERANQLAHYLQSLGVKSATLVPICITRSLEMIVGILGILKAGGAYVPIDPDYPAERISYMLADTGADIILGNRAAAASLPASKDRRIITLDEEERSIRTYPKEAPSTTLTANCLAYVIYTSGSTGKPKGVMVEHRSVVNLFKATASLYDFNSRDVWTLFHSFCFDFSVWEMYGALFHGARLIIVPKHIAQDATLFGELIMTQGVTVLNQTPPAFSVLQDHLTATTAVVPVRYVIFGGEALNPAKLQTWMQVYPHCRLINMYGITEATVHATYQPVTREHLNSGSVIGKALPSLGIYILDAHQQLSPVGVAGELYIGGAALARGYLGLPQLTAKRFVANPFSGETGARLYRTGDAASWLPDGNIAYLGRIDEQVKIRGYRIEPGEIENVLLACEGVKQAVVIAREDVTGNKRLLGYVVPEGTFNREAVLAHLSSRLPEYMIPAFLLELESVPLTTNGKVNKSALPEPDAGALSQQAYVAPRNETEQALAEIWQEMLGVERVGIYDNFFELGGHSLLLVATTTKINNYFNADLAPLELLHNPLIIKLTALLEEAKFKKDPSTDKNVVLLNGKKDQNIMMFPPAMGQGLGYTQLAGLIPSYSLYSFNFIDDEKRLDTYTELIGSIQPEGPYILLGYSAGGNLAFEVAKALISNGQQVSDIIMIDAIRMSEKISIPAIGSISAEEKNAFKERIEREAAPGKQFKVDEHFIERLLNNTYNYLKYHAGTVNEGSIPSNIHLVKNGETSNDDLLLYDWRNATSGNYTIYQGKGKHLEMFSLPENRAHHASLINKILAGIKAGASVSNLQQVHV